jgi:WD40 repeat protein
MGPKSKSRTRSGGVGISGSTVDTRAGDIVGRDKIEHHHHYYSAGTHALAGPVLYNLPSLPPRYQPREEDLAGIKARLLTDRTTIGITSVARTLGLHGMGGIGKTVLATALVHDPDLRVACADGMVWLTFSRDVQVLSKAAELAFVLSGTSTNFGNLAEARGRLGLLTREKRLLVILDDVWEPGAVDAFTGIGPDCRLLITTRDNRVLTRARAYRHELGLLDGPAARAFLAQAVGIEPDSLPSEAEAIVLECGRLPLALAAVGALIRSKTYTWTDTLAALREAALEELDTDWLPDPEQRSLAIVLKLSVDALTVDVRACFLDCAAFREDVDIPEATLARLWSSRVAHERAAKRVVQDLVDRSLMRPNEGSADGRLHYRIHDLYMDYLHYAARPLRDRHRFLIERYGEGCQRSWVDGPNDGYFVQQLPWHFHEVGEHQVLRSLLFDFFWLRRKLAIAGIWALINDFELLRDDREVSYLSATLGLSAHVLGPHPEQLTTQLRARLVEEDGPTIARLIATLGQEIDSPLSPVHNGSLIGPGPLLRTIPTDDGTAEMVLVDGRRAISSSYDDGTLHLWDLETGAELRRLEGHQKRITAIAMLPNGPRVLSGSEDDTLRLWEIDTGAELRRFDESHGWVTAIAAMSDGQHALTGSFDGTLLLRDLIDGIELRRFVGHRSWVSTLCILADGRHFLSGSGSDDATLRLWDLETGAELCRFEGHEETITAIAVLRDMRRVLSGSWDYTFRVWDLDSGKELQRLDSGCVTAMAVLRDGQRVLTGSDDGTLSLWDLKSGIQLRRFDGHYSGITAIALLPNGRHVLTASDDNTLRLWDLDSAPQSRRFDGHYGRVTAIALLPGGRHVLSGGGDSTLRLWDLDSGFQLRHFTADDGSVIALKILPDGRRVLSSSRDGPVHLWNIRTGMELCRFDKHYDWVRVIALLPGGRRALTGSADKTLRLWDLITGASLRYFVGHDEQITEIAILAEGRRALSCSYDKTLRLWDVGTGRQLRRFDGHSEAVWTMAVLPNERHALSGSPDKTLRLWDLAAGSELRRFEGHDSWINAIAVLADGRRALSGSHDKTLRLWDLHTGAQLRLFDGHDAAVNVIALLPDGRHALSGSDDRTLRLWNLDAGTELASFTCDAAILEMAPTRDGSRVVIGDANGQVIGVDIRL